MVADWARPVPDKLRVTVPFDASEAIDTVPVRVPAAVGVNVTVTVQVPPELSVDVQVLDWEKSDEPALTVTLLTVNVEVPLLVRVTVCVAAVDAICVAA